MFHQKKMIQKNFEKTNVKVALNVLDANIHIYIYIYIYILPVFQKKVLLRKMIGIIKRNNIEK